MRGSSSVPFHLYFKVLLAAAVLACAACGDQMVTGFEDGSGDALQISSSAGAEQSRIDRSVEGHPLLVHSAVFVQGTAEWPYVGLFLTDSPDLCSQLTQGILPPSMTNVAFTFGSVDPHVAPVGSNVDSGQALAGYAQSDATCHNRLEAGLSSGSAGSLRVEGLDMNGRLHGTFDVLLGTEGQHVSGTFVAVECPPAVKLFDCSNALACR